MTPVSSSKTKTNKVVESFKTLVLRFVARQCTLRDLTPGCKYRVYIRTINTGQIESDWSQVELATKSDRPEAPTDISVTAVQSQMVAIEWSPPKPNGSPITGKECTYPPFYY